MRTQILLVVIVLLATAAFAVLNWPALNTPAPINLLLVEPQGPLGLVVLGLTTLLIALFVLLVVSLQANVLLEARRHSRELSVQRELADKAEASRFTELRELLAQEFATVRGSEGPHRETLARLDRLEEALGKEIHDSGNTLAAYLGELEDRLEARQVIPADEQHRHGGA